MRNIGHIFRKELLELRRDKRTFYSAVIGPVFLIFLMLYSLSFIQKSVSDTASHKLHVVKSNGSNAFLEAIRRVKEIKIIEVDSVAAGRKLIEEGKAKVVLDFERVEKSAPIKADAIYDPDEIKANILISILEGLASKTNQETVGAILDAAGVSKDQRSPIQLKTEPITKQDNEGAAALAGMLPYLIVIWAFYGAFGIASEAVASEKEKQTLETLLIAPVKRREVAIGKFLSLFSISLVSCLVSIASIAILGPMIASKSMFANGLQVSPMAMLAMIGVIIPLCAMFAGILLAVSAFARNVRECQTYLTLISFVVLIPAVFSQFIGFTDFARAQWVSWVPVLNTATVLRMSLLDKIDGRSVAITIGLSLVLSAIAIYFAMRMFEREKILIRI